MKFFLSSEGFMYRARICGFPCYVTDPHGGELEVSGTNVVSDWCIAHLVPWVQWAIDWAAVLLWGHPTDGFGIEILERLPDRK